jgi:hypothetical protein
MTAQASQPSLLGAPTPAMPERAARYLPGLPVLFLSVVAIGGAIACLAVSGSQSGAAVPALIAAGAALLVGAVLGLTGLTPVVPGRARVVQLFGTYRGTIRDAGLKWVNPFTARIRVSTRIRNLETALAKVNDADGNPIEIAAVVVWQVQDTALANYAVDDYAKFVAIQAETAVRHIASSYPYDGASTDGLSLRDNADEVTERLAVELSDRVQAAGVRVIETRLTRLSYAAEIAQAMLRKQQASAVVAARQRIVEGAVGMVRLALRRLDEENVVELDEERKAAMVSNLLVVLCSEQATQQVVNTGSLYQ